MFTNGKGRHRLTRFTRPMGHKGVTRGSYTRFLTQQKVQHLFEPEKSLRTNDQIRKIRQIWKILKFAWKTLEWLNIDPVPVIGLNSDDFGQEIRPCLKIFDDQGRLRKPKLRAGGGPTKRVHNRILKFEEAKLNQGPVTMCDWDGWMGPETQGRRKSDEQSDKLIGGAKAPGAIETYNRCFRRWSEFRELRNKPALINPQEDIREAERGALRFTTLRHAPLQKSASAVELYMRAMAYMHRPHTGLNPINDTFRVKLSLRGARRGEGPPNRKIPVSCEDLIEIYHGVTPGCINEGIIFCVVLLGWYFMIRKSEYLGHGIKGNIPSTFRHSIRVMDLEPYFDSNRVTWGQPCDSVTLHIHGRWTSRGVWRAIPSNKSDGPPEACGKIREGRRGRHAEDTWFVAAEIRTIQSK